MQDQGGTTAEFSATEASSPPGWLDRARAALPGPGCYLIEREEHGATRVLPIESGWTRIGRSVTADIRLDDPSVSRRHALLVLEGESMRVLDDRSLNGVIVNGEQVEWGRLGDGDELTIGRYRLYLLEA